MAGASGALAGRRTLSKSRNRTDPGQTPVSEPDLRRPEANPASSGQHPSPPSRPPLAPGDAQIRTGHLSTLAPDNARFRTKSAQSSLHSIKDGLRLPPHPHQLHSPRQKPAFGTSSLVSCFFPFVFHFPKLFPLILQISNPPSSRRQFTRPRTDGRKTLSLGPPGGSTSTWARTGRGDSHTIHAPTRRPPILALDHHGRPHRRQHNHGHTGYSYTGTDPFPSLGHWHGYRKNACLDPSGISPGGTGDGGTPPEPNH